MWLFARALGLVAAQDVSENDPVVASAHLWDLDHNGTYTCDEWREYATRPSRSAGGSCRRTWLKRSFRTECIS